MEDRHLRVNVADNKKNRGGGRGGGRGGRGGYQDRGGELCEYYTKSAN